MSRRKERMAVEKKASRKARLAPLHAAQADRREAERKERAAEWSKKHKAKEAAK